MATSANRSSPYVLSLSARWIVCSVHPQQPCGVVLLPMLQVVLVGFHLLLHIVEDTAVAVYDTSLKRSPRRNSRMNPKGQSPQVVKQDSTFCCMHCLYKVSLAWRISVL